MFLSRNLENAKPMMKFTPIEPGTYPAIIIAAEGLKSKNGNKMLKLVFMITGGEYHKRQVYQYLVLEGNDKAQEITNSFMKAVNLALGLPLNGFDTEAVLNKGLVIDLYNSEDVDAYGKTRVQTRIGFVEKKSKEDSKPVDQNFSADDIPF